MMARSKGVAILWNGAAGADKAGTVINNKKNGAFSDLHRRKKPQVLSIGPDPARRLRPLHADLRPGRFGGRLGGLERGLVALDEPLDGVADRPDALGVRSGREPD